MRWIVRETFFKKIYNCIIFIVLAYINDSFHHSYNSIYSYLVPLYCGKHLWSCLIPNYLNCPHKDWTQTCIDNEIRIRRAKCKTATRLTPNERLVRVVASLLRVFNNWEAEKVLGEIESDRWNVMEVVEGDTCCQSWSLLNVIRHHNRKGVRQSETGNPIIINSTKFKVTRGQKYRILFPNLNITLKPARIEDQRRCRKYKYTQNSNKLFLKKWGHVLVPCWFQLNSCKNVGFNDKIVTSSLV